MDNFKIMDNFEITLIVISAISCFSSLCVITTYLFFPNLQKKLHTTLIFYVSLCDFFANLGSSIGQPKNGTIGCWIQALLTTYFYTAGLFWVTAVCYVLYSLVFHGEVNLSMKWIHILSWGISLFVTFIPLIHITYGRIANEPGWCYLYSFQDDSKWELPFWAFITFYLWLAIAEILMFVWGGMIYYRIQVKKSKLANVVIKALNRLLLYPMLILLSWLAISINQLAFQYINPVTITPLWVTYVSYIPAVLQGFFSSIIFFANDSEVRNCWYYYVLNKSSDTNQTIGSDDLLEDDISFDRTSNSFQLLHLRSDSQSSLRNSSIEYDRDRMTSYDISSPIQQQQQQQLRNITTSISLTVEEIRNSVALDRL